MDDQPKLESYYDRSLENASQYLRTKYQAVKVNAVTAEKTRFPETYLLKDLLEGSDLEIILSLPYNFPDTFPKVTIPEPLFARIYPIPHLNSLKVLCTFDDNVAHPNVTNPEGILDEVISRAFELIKAGISGSNTFDYLDEFDSYWAQETEEEILSLISISSEAAKEVFLLTFDHPHWKSSHLICDTELEGEEWLLKAGAKLNKSATRAFYMPLPTIGVPPFPKTNGELIKLIRELGSEHVSSLINFLNRNNRPTMVLCSIPHGEKHILAAWEHPITSQFKTSPYIGKRRLKKSLDGFRSSKRNAILELQRDFRTLKITKYDVTRVDRERLLVRGGDGILPLSHKIGVIGCGSIGSHVISSLVDSGVEQFTLIDKELLTFENIARHTLGAYHVGMPKVDGINKSLKMHFPHLRITTYPEDILKALRDHETLLNGLDLSIVALGNFPVESRLDKLQQEGIISTPMIYVWVEPYLAAGHAVYINPAYPGCYHCLFDEHHNYFRSALDKPEMFSMREAGCQSTYVPYKVTEIKRFISDLSFFIEDILAGKVSENIAFTWLGNLDLQKGNGRLLKSKWALADNYTVRRIPLGETSLCEVCKRRE